MAVILSISVVVTLLVVATGPVLGIDPGAETDLVLEAEDLVQGHDQVREQDPARGQVRDKNQVRWIDQGNQVVPERDKNQVRWIDRGHHLVQDRVQAGKVPLVANGIVEDLHQGTVNVVRPVVPANQDQEHHGVQQAEAGVAADPRAAVVVDVAEEVEVEVVDADVDPK